MRPGLGARPSASRSAASSSAVVAGTGRRCAAGVEAVPVEPHLEPVAEADEGVARQALAALHALQQEARRKGRELHERRDRRVEISWDVE